MRRTVTLLALFTGVGLLAAACSRAGAAEVSTGCREKPMVALTFDDGPNPPYTQEVLDELEAHGARATFFVEGEAAARSPQVVAREVRMGMAVGSHSERHRQDYASESRDQFETDLEAALAGDLIGEATMAERQHALERDQAFERCLEPAIARFEQRADIFVQRQKGALLVLDCFHHQQLSTRGARAIQAADTGQQPVDKVGARHLRAENEAIPQRG